MAEAMEKHGRLEIDEDFQHHVRAWRVKRVGWCVMAGLLIAALGGLLGPGPYSNDKLEAGKGLKLEYQRLVRYNAPTFFHLKTPAGEDSFELSLDSEFIKAIELERINPEPEEMRLDGEKHTWIFQRTNAPGEIQITFRPQGFGSKPVRLETKDAGKLEFKQFFLP